MMSEKVEVVDGSNPLANFQKTEGVEKDGIANVDNAKTPVWHYHAHCRSPAMTSPNPSKLSTLKKFLGDGLVHEDNVHFDDPEKSHRSEPDGNARTTPPFQESGTPPYQRWASDLHYLLDDEDGVKLYLNYLKNEGCAHSLEFWLAGQGIKKSVPNDEFSRLVRTINAIYKKYVRSSSNLSISKETRQTIDARIQNKKYDYDIFDVAVQEVEAAMEVTTYRSFLQSDQYVQHIQEMQNGGFESSEGGSGNQSGGSNDENLKIGYLQTVEENEELQVDAEQVGSLPLTLHHLQLTQRKRVYSEPLRRTEDGNVNSHNVAHPYHPMYAACVPVSAQDSELQSLSSGAHTDTDISLPDNVEGGNMFTKKHVHSRYHQQMRKEQIQQNVDAPNCTIPRTQRVTKDEHLAKADPKEFVKVITEKLNKFKQDQDNKNKLHELGVVEPLPEAPVDVTCSGQPVPLFSPALFKFNGPEDSSQSILDDHVSRVFRESHDDLPMQSRGWRKAHFQSLQHPSRSGNGSGELMNNSYPRMPAAASGSHKHGHHHTLSNGKKGNSKATFDAECEPPLHDSGHFELESNEPSNERRTKEHAKCSSGRRNSDSTHVRRDSGISIQEAEAPLNRSINSHERVTLWMLGNEKYSNSHQPDSEKDSSARHRRSSHSSATSPIPNRSGRGKKPLAYNSSRCGSLEQCQHRGCGMHPLVQDPQMRPDPKEQLEAARKRLEDDSKAKVARNKSSHLAKDKTAHSEKGRFVGKPFDGEMVDECGNMVMRRSGRKSLSSSPAPMSTAGDTSEFVIVGYYIGGEQYPYRTRISGKNVTLRQFKSLITKKGNFRYFFKTASDEFGTGVVNEEVTDDNQVLPLWEGKIMAQVELVEES